MLSRTSSFSFAAFAGVLAAQTPNYSGTWSIAPTASYSCSFGLAVIGMPNCDARVSLDVTDAISGTGTAASWQLVVPNQTNLLGLRFYQQALVFDPGFNPFNAVMSDAATLTIGL